jgi:hypothetical protein
MIRQSLFITQPFCNFISLPLCIYFYFYWKYSLYLSSFFLFIAYFLLFSYIFFFLKNPLFSLTFSFFYDQIFIFSPKIKSANISAPRGRESWSSVFIRLPSHKTIKLIILLLKIKLEALSDTWMSRWEVKPSWDRLCVQINCVNSALSHDQCMARTDLPPFSFIWRT